LKPIDDDLPSIVRPPNRSISDVPTLYLLDTNTLSHLVRQPQGPVAERIAAVGEANVLTSVIVACELRYGAAKRGSRRLTKQVEAVLWRSDRSLAGV
jgi:predicted nucleic acid-binding protein